MNVLHQFNFFDGCEDFISLVAHALVRAASTLGCGSAALWGSQSWLPPPFRRRGLACWEADQPALTACPTCQPGLESNSPCSQPSKQPSQPTNSASPNSRRP